MWGPLNPDSEKCTFCGSYIVIKTDLPKLDRRTLNQSVIQDHINDFRRRVRTNSYDEEAHYGLGVAYYNLGLIEEAIDELAQSARLMPENPHIQAQLAVALRNSFMDGNHSAEQKMNTRIQNALLLDPDHFEANLLKAEVLLDDNQYEEAIQVLDPLLDHDEHRITPRIVAATNDLFSLRVADSDWEGAQRCWQYLEPVDSDAAKALAVRFLNMASKRVPRRVVFKEPLGDYPRMTERGTPKGILFALGGAISGLLAGLLQLLAVFSIAPRNSATDAITGWGTWAFFVSVLLLFASPIVGAIVAYKRTGGAKVTSRTDFKVLEASKKDVLSGAAELEVIKRVAADVVSIAIRQGDYFIK